MAVKEAAKGVVKKAIIKAVGVPVIVTIFLVGLLIAALMAFTAGSAASASESCTTGGSYVSQSASGAPNMSAVNDAMAVAQQLGASETIVTAMLQTGVVETSSWRNLASLAVPESISFPHDGEPAKGDADSVGIFQQRASWGSVADRMQPRYQATKFIEEGKKREGGVATITDPVARAAELAAQVQRPAAQYRYRYGSDATQAGVAEIRGKLAAKGPAAQIPAGINPDNNAAAAKALEDAENSNARAQEPNTPDLKSFPVAPTTVSVGQCSNGADSGTGQFVVGSTVTVHKYGKTEGPAYTFAIPTGPAGVAIQSALAQLGDPYVWGATGPDTFDCSGLTSFAYKAAGLNIPRTSGAQSDWGKANGADVTNAPHLPGDLIHAPGHITMYLGTAVDAADPTKKVDIMIEAPQTGDRVKISTVRKIRTYADNNWIRPTTAAKVS